jgi:hypothetical protein
MWVTGGALLFGVALPAVAQAPPATTVTSGNVNLTFGGEMRTIFYAADNISDFADSKAGLFRDSENRVLQRFRLITNVDSADKKAGLRWILEIGDITWGSGGGASGGEYGTGGTRNFQGGGGELGADGVNVETKRLMFFFDVPGVPNLRVSTGIQGFAFLDTASSGAFFGDDASGVKVTWKADPVDLEVYWAKLAEGSNFNADDVDMWVARIGVNVTKDARFTIEGMVVDTNCPNLPLTTPAGIPVLTGCQPADFGDNFWVGGTFGINIGTIKLDGQLVYGQRQIGPNAQESGYGVNTGVTVPVGPVTVLGFGWYTSGDDTVGPGGASNLANRVRDSDRLPIPAAFDSWGQPQYIAEFLLGATTLAQFNDESDIAQRPNGTYGIGGSASFAVTPTFSLGGGVAYVGATDAASLPPAGFGDNAFEVDTGFSWRLATNVRADFVAGYIVPDQGDEAWGVGMLVAFRF